MNSYCERENRVTDFVFKRTAEGTFWQCEECGLIINDLTKYKALYSKRLQREIPPPPSMK
jgi:ribosomal protein L37AE/L43A